MMTSKEALGIPMSRRVAATALGGGLLTALAVVTSSADPAAAAADYWERGVDADVIDARWHGVVANGTTDDTAALQAALTAAVTEGKSLLLPFGRVLVTGVITVPAVGTARQVALIGHGPQESEILLRGSGRLDLDLGVCNEWVTGHLVLREVGIRCDSVNTVTAVTVRLQRVSGATTQAAIVENFEVTGVSDTTGPKIGLRFIDACAVRIRGGRIQGVRSGSHAGSVGILLQGGSIPVEIYVSEVNTYFLETSFHVDGVTSGRLEGIHFDKVAAVACDFGVVAKANDNDQSLWVKVTGSHFNCWKGAIATRNFGNVLFQSNLIYGLPQTPSVPFIGINISMNPTGAAGHLSIVSDNIVIYQGATTAAKNGLLIDSNAGAEDTVLVSNNVFGFFDTGVLLGSGAQRAAVASTNLFRGNANTVVNYGTGNVVAPVLASS